MPPSRTVYSVHSYLEGLLVSRKMVVPRSAITRRGSGVPGCRSRNRSQQSRNQAPVIHSDGHTSLRSHCWTPSTFENKLLRVQDVIRDPPSGHRSQNTMVTATPKRDIYSPRPGHPLPGPESGALRGVLRRPTYSQSLPSKRLCSLALAGFDEAASRDLLTEPCATTSSH